MSERTGGFSNESSTSQPTDGLSALLNVPFSNGKATPVYVYRQRAVPSTSVLVFRVRVLEDSTYMVNPLDFASVLPQEPIWAPARIHDPSNVPTSTHDILLSSLRKAGVATLFRFTVPLCASVDSLEYCLPRHFKISQMSKTLKIGSRAFELYTKANLRG